MNPNSDVENFLLSPANGGSLFSVDMVTPLTSASSAPTPHSLAMEDTTPPRRLPPVTKKPLFQESGPPELSSPVDIPLLGVDGLLSPTDTLITQGPPLASSLDHAAVEREVVKQLVWALIGIPGSVVNGAGASADLVGSTLAAAVGRVLPVALNYCRVMSCVEEWRRAHSSIVLPPLAFALHSQLQRYRLAVQSLDSVFRSTDGLSLPRLLHQVHVLAPPLTTLGRVCDAVCSLDPRLSAASVLNALHALCERAVDVDELRALQDILNATFEPYASILDAWMDVGAVAVDLRRELCISPEGFPREDESVVFVEPVVQHIAAAGRYAAALELDKDPVVLVFNIANLHDWHSAIRAKCASVAAQVTAQLRTHGLRDFVMQLHALCVTAHHSAALEMGLRGILDMAVLDAPPLHMLEKRVVEVARFPAATVTLRLANDPNQTVRQALEVSAVAPHPLSIVIGAEALAHYSALFRAIHRVVHVRHVVGGLFVECRRAFRSSCHSLTFIRLAVALLSALLDNAVFLADAALQSLLPALEVHVLEQLIASHNVYLLRCAAGALQTHQGANEALQLCLDTIEAFVMFARRVFDTPGALAQRQSMEQKAAAMTGILHASVGELIRHVDTLAEREGAWLHLGASLRLLTEFRTAT